MQRHGECLQHFCRLCGADNLGARNGDTLAFKTEILSAYGVDVSDDNKNIHPAKICFSCLKKLYLVRSALKTGKDYSPQNTTAYTYIEHCDVNCYVCKEEASPQTQRGRPTKKRGGKRKCGQPVKLPKAQLSTSVGEEVKTDNFQTFKEELFHLPLYSVPYNWGVNKCDDYVIMTQVNGVPIPIIKTSMTIKEDSYTVYVHNRPLPEDHELYLTRGRKILNLQQLSAILDDISKFTVCNGNPDEEFVEMFTNISPMPTRAGFKEEHHQYENHDGKVYNSTVRTTNCELFVHKQRCGKCIAYRNTLRAMCSKQNGDEQKDITKVNYRYLNKEQLTSKFIAQTADNVAAKEEIKRLRALLDTQIEKQGVELDTSISTEINKLMTANQEPPFPNDTMKTLLWEQQVKAANAKNPRNIRWHPTIIKWCLNLNMISSKAYKTISESGALQLPTIRTLQDYTHYIKVKSGFQPEVLEQMVNQAKSKGIFDGEEYKTYVVLLLDEMKIKRDLVFDKHTGELIGFTNLGDINEELNLLNENQNEMATHMMAVMVRSICANFKFQLAHYPTAKTTAGDIFPIVWELVEHLELSGFKVLAITCDGASINRRFFKMHQPEGASAQYLTYSTPNVFALDERPLYFFADPPHLLKTVRNCWSNSYSHKTSRKLWVS